MDKRVILIILDGWGLGQNAEVSAIAKSKTPFINQALLNFPNSRLEASGEAVGLPDGQMGNSEVGHMNIGAGRVVYQDLVKINKAIDEKELFDNGVVNEAFEYAKENDKNIHIIGLVSEGGVHSHIRHLKGICEIAKEKNNGKFFIHAFTDGRDTDPKSGIRDIEATELFLKDSGGVLASVIGRYYAMDRDKRWERVKLAYDLLVHGKGEKVTDMIWAIRQSYMDNITDEFIKPIVRVDDLGNPVAVIKPGDVVLCFNFRTDRGRQITQVLSQCDLPEYNMYKLPLHYITLTNYDESFQNVRYVFGKDNLNNTLGEVLSNAGKKQIRIAETEKYPHVTFFFSGGQEKPFVNEFRILCPSPKVATYDLKPEMSAFDIRDAIIPELEKEEVDFICLNFANPDMVGHTGVIEAAIKACETVDSCAKSIVDVAQRSNYSVVIIADHGNADIMINEDGTPNTAHTTNLVPCIIIDKDINGKLKDGKLADIAPTILDIMGIAQPLEMKGKSLIKIN